MKHSKLIVGILIINIVIGSYIWFFLEIPGHTIELKYTITNVNNFNITNSIEKLESENYEILTFSDQKIIGYITLISNQGESIETFIYISINNDSITISSEKEISLHLYEFFVGVDEIGNRNLDTMKDEFIEVIQILYLPINGTYNKINDIDSLDYYGSGTLFYFMLICHPLILIALFTIAIILKRSIQQSRLNSWNMVSSVLTI